MKPIAPDDLDERYESLPWEQVGPTAPADRRWMLIAAAAVVVAAVAASAARTLWPAPPLSAPELPAPTVLREAAPAVEPSEPADDFQLVTEADLRAISPVDAERAVGAHAEWFVSEWLTLDAEPSGSAVALLPEALDLPSIDESARSFVESAVALSTEEVALGSWEVAVLVRTLSALEDGEYTRIPARVFLVTIGIGDDGPFVADVPTPGALPAGRGRSLDLISEPAPHQIVEAAIATMAEAGVPDETTLTTERWADLWRVSGVVRDQAGVPVVVAVWLDESGERVPAPG